MTKETHLVRHPMFAAMTLLQRYLNAENVIGILPGYFEASAVQGNVLRLLGDGEVCSEHLDLLCQEHNAQPVAAAIGRYLTSHSDAWDAWHLDSFCKEDSFLAPLVEYLLKRGSHESCKLGSQRWSIELPQTWDEFLAMQSKSHRKQLRRLESRVLNTGEAQWNLVKTGDEFEEAWATLIDLHLAGD